MRSATSVVDIGGGDFAVAWGEFMEDLPHVLRGDESGDLFECNFDPSSLRSFK